MQLFNLGRANAKPNAEKLGYFNDETIRNLFVEFTRLRSKMYLVIVFDSSELISEVNNSMDGRQTVVANAWRALKSSALSTSKTFAFTIVEP